MPTLIDEIKDALAHPEKYAAYRQVQVAVPESGYVQAPRGLRMMIDNAPRPETAFERYTAERMAEFERMVGRVEGFRVVEDPTLRPDQVLMVSTPFSPNSVASRIEQESRRRFNEVVFGDGRGSMTTTPIRGERGRLAGTDYMPYRSEIAPGPRICACGYTSMFTGELDAHLASCEQSPSRDVLSTPVVIEAPQPPPPNPPQFREAWCHHCRTWKNCRIRPRSGEAWDDFICRECWDRERLPASTTATGAAIEDRNRGYIDEFHQYLREYMERSRAVNYRGPSDLHRNEICGTCYRPRWCVQMTVADDRGARRFWQCDDCGARPTSASPAPPQT